MSTIDLDRFRFF